MKKKVLGSVVAAALIAVLALVLVGCTVTGTYSSSVFGKIEFSGKTFTHTSEFDTITAGEFTTEKITDEAKTEAEKDFIKLGLNKDTVEGTITLKNDKDEVIAKGFYGKNADDKAYVAILGFVSGVFTKD